MKSIVSFETRLLDALALMAPQSSKNTLRTWLKEGRVQVDHITIKNGSLKLMKGQVVSVGQRKKILHPGIAILYEDHDLIIIDKPAGLLSVATAFEKEETAQAILKAHYHSYQLFVVHRLDQETSGVMVFALNQEACNRLKNIFELHTIERAYTAIVEGQLTIPKGTWKSYQYEDSQYRVHETQDQTKGRLAITHFQTVAFSKHYTWLQLKLETGRKNQIRVHCQSAGHSVVGDKKYGSRSNFSKRLCLHAHC